MPDPGPQTFFSNCPPEVVISDLDEEPAKNSSESVPVPRRMSPRAMIAAALIVALIMIAIGVGVGYGLRRRESTSSAPAVPAATVTRTSLSR